MTVPVRQVIPRDWQRAATQSKYRAAVFAEMLQLSPRQLLRQCQKEYHCSAKKLLIHLQMLAALELLVQTASLREVIVQLGFQTPASFGRRFKEYFGVTPWEFVHRKPHSVG